MQRPWQRNLRGDFEYVCAQPYFFILDTCRLPQNLCVFFRGSRSSHIPAEAALSRQGINKLGPASIHLLLEINFFLIPGRLRHSRTDPRLILHSICHGQISQVLVTSHGGLNNVKSPFANVESTFSNVTSPFQSISPFANCHHFPIVKFVKSTFFQC